MNGDENIKLKIDTLSDEIFNLRNSAWFIDKKGKTIYHEKCKEMLVQAENKINELILLERIQEKPLVDELKKIGYEVDTVGRLANTKEPYDNILPLLYEHIQKDYVDNIKAAITIVFLNSNSKAYRPFFRDLFIKRPKISHSIFSDMIANVLLKYSGKKEIYDIISLIEKEAICESRVLLLTLLKRYRNKSIEAMEAIKRLSKNPVFEREIKGWKLNIPD